jgi:nuclear pore complex protein Nup188
MKETAFLSHRTYVPFPEAFEIINLYKFTTPLTSIISTTILQHPRTERHLQEEYIRTFSAESSATPPAHGPARRAPPPADDSSFYIESPKAIKAVTSCFITTSSAPGAAIPALAWSLILLDIISFVNAASQEEDSDPFSNASAGRGERHPTVELYENVLSGLFEGGSAEKEIKRLANSVVRDALEAIVLMIEPSGTVGDAFLGVKFWIGSEEDGNRMKNVLASLVRKALPDLSISGEVLMTVLLVHELQYNDLASYISFLDDEAEKGGEDSTGWTGSAAGRFMKHGEAMRFLRRAKNRFPYEPILFLRLIRALAFESGEVTKDLVKMDTYTQVLPPGFEDYDVDNEDSDIGRIQLTNDLLVFAPRDGGVFEDEYAPRGGIVIPAGTIGEITSTGGGRLVVAWKHEYNALPLFGRVLEYALIGEGSDSGAGGLMAGELGTGETATEIISLLTMLIASGTARPDKAAEGFDVARILEEASDNVGRSRDVVSIIFDLLEAGLQDTAQSSNTGKSTEFIVAALQFVDALIKIIPGRVWPFIARSTILERNGRGGAFVSILSAVEVVRGDYEFTVNCLNLFEHLIEEAIQSSVVNMGGSRSLQLASMASNTTTRSGVSMSVQREILTSWTRVTVDVFESYRGWKYVNREQRLDIGRHSHSLIYCAILTESRSTYCKDILSDSSPGLRC